MKMNKKAQYGQQEPSPFGSVHPVLIIGIIVCIVPFFNFVLSWNSPSWLYGLGIVIILFGGVLSMIKSTE